MKRRDFDLPAEDSFYLDSLGLEWATISAQGKGVIIEKYPLPVGFSSKAVDVLLLLDGYPIAQIDMVYFEPHLSLETQRTIAATAQHTFDGRNWQRWSRHRTTAHPWDSRKDNISSHMALVAEWLEQALRK